MNDNFPFHNFPQSGAVFVTEEAIKKGFVYGDNKWSNLGQGSPEMTALKNAPQRRNKVKISAVDHGYAPVVGLKALREQVATLYNDLFRWGKKSKLTYANVAIGGGGRLGLSRIFSTVDKVNVGYFVPDYTSYQGILSVFNNSHPVPIFLDSKEGFEVDLKKLEEEIKEKKIKVLLLSNPANPTGTLIQGKKLKKLVELSEKLDFYLILDEFYFNYIYTKRGEMISGAEFVEDVNKSHVIMISGLTKAWRYPGWRISWVIASEEVIEGIVSVSTFLDGGANRPLQNEALKIVDKYNLMQETLAIQKRFKHKRNFMIHNLEKMGFEIENEPQGSFYLWANLSKLPEEINTGMEFFEAGLREKVITVPGVFFDINPYQKRKEKRLENYCRISYSGNMRNLKRGIKAFDRLIKTYS